MQCSRAINKVVNIASICRDWERDREQERETKRELDPLLYKCRCLQLQPQPQPQPQLQSELAVSAPAAAMSLHCVGHKRFTIMARLLKSFASRTPLRAELNQWNLELNQLTQAHIQSQNKILWKSANSDGNGDVDIGID